MKQKGEKRWVLPPKTDVEPDELVGQVLKRRGLAENSDFELEPDYHTLADPYLLPDMQLAVDHILSLRGKAEETVIYGDYDIDGITATTLLVTGLKAMGIAASAYIPDRFEEGYCLNQAALIKLAKDGVKTVITVDCGSTAIEPLKTAAELDLSMIVTDHHQLAETEPVGLVAHINPNRKSNKYPNEHLAGVGVAWHLLRALQFVSTDLMKLGQEKWWLDLVALGTVCDVVPLTGENRLLAKYGLKVLAQSRRPGIIALAKNAGIDMTRLEASDLGFKLGPRLNAAGRLEHAQAALNVLLEMDSSKAQQYADRLDSLNRQRQELVSHILEEARVQAQDQLQFGFLVLANKNWSHGVAGLIAARIAEEFSRPTAVLQIEGTVAKGSVRSFAHLNVLNLLRSADKLMTKYGGHAAAAGLTIPTDLISDLRDQLNMAISKRPKSEWISERSADLWLNERLISKVGLVEMERFEPTGRGHEQIVFVIESTILDVRWVGADQSHAQILLRMPSGPQSQKAVAFSASRLWPWLMAGQRVRGFLSLTSSVWQGVERPELHVIDLVQITE